MFTTAITDHGQLRTFLPECRQLLDNSRHGRFQLSEEVVADVLQELRCVRCRVET